MVDGIAGYGGNVLPFPVLRPMPAPVQQPGPDAVRPVESGAEARGPATRERSPDAALRAVDAARTAQEVAAAQFLHGLGPHGRLPRITR